MTDGEGSIGVIGGTGPQGTGLAIRFALAGHPVLIGSRDPAKAFDVAGEMRDKAGRPVDLEGVANAQAASDCEMAIVTVPYDAQQQTLTPLAGLLQNKIVINCVNALGFDAAGPYAVPVPDGSAAQECARLLPHARVCSAFSNVSATKLLRIGEPVEVDVLVCGDDHDAKERVMALAGEIAGMQGVDAGPLRMAGTIEDLTAVLIGINRRYKIHAGIRIDGLPRPS